MRKIVMLFLSVILFAGIALAEEGHAPVNWLQIPWGFSSVTEMLNPHPLFTHFPIALLTGSLLFYLLGLIFGSEQFLITGKWSLIAGALAAGLTVWTGHEAGEAAEHAAGLHGILEAHEYCGFAVLGLSAVLGLWALVSRAGMPQKGRGLFLILMIMLCAVLAQGADLGGRLVYLNGVGVGRKSMTAKDPGHHQHGNRQKAETSPAKESVKAGG